MLRGDYGPDRTVKVVQPGEAFAVEDFQAKRMRHLEEKGIIERIVQRPTIMSKALANYQNKSLRVAATK